MIIIRPLKESDAAAAARLEADIFTEPWSERAFLETLKCQYAYYYAAGMSESDIVGISGLRDIAGEGEITNVAVDVRYRGKGIAKALLTRLLQKGNELGISAYTLEVRVSNTAAINLYKNFGFKAEGVRKKFYQKPCEDAVIMWKRQEEHGRITTVFPHWGHV